MTSASILAAAGAARASPSWADPCADLAVSADPAAEGTTRSAVTSSEHRSPPLAADLNDGLKRLKMAAMRRLAPELLLTAKTQRWNPEELLRTLVEAEIAARDESNARTRLRSAAFPVAKSLDEFDLAAVLHPASNVRLPRQLRMDPSSGELLLDRASRHRQEPPPCRARCRRGRGRAPGPVLHRRRTRGNPLPGISRQLRWATSSRTCCATT